MESRDQSDVIPNQSYLADHQSHFAHSQYPYPPTSAPFSIDQDMTMDHFAAGVQESANTPISEPPMASTGASNPMPAHTTTTSLATPGMAPPQTGGSQSYSDMGPRASIDDGLDSMPMGGDPRRKRSKVSRACDECRRKKVRCDAAGDDGSIKTCSNCQRAGVTCGYNRVPMKRGPSKGYIKELSERVQQVESQMAMSSTPTGLSGFRQSLDGSSTMYPDQLYSPEDQTSFKRNFSFSDQRSPFTNPDFTRDRIPSVGGWPTSSPQASNLRARDRGSLAIAPDQQSPNLTTHLAKPYWAVEHDGSPSVKRQKLDDSIEGPEVTAKLLDDYHQDVHPNMPLLSDFDTTMTIVRKAGGHLQHAFCAAIYYLPSATAKAVDEKTNGSTAVHIRTVFKTREELEEFIYNAFRENHDAHSREHNLVLSWVQLLMAIGAENDLSRLRSGPLPKAILIKQVIEFGWQCIQKEYQTLPSLDCDTRSTMEYRDHLARTWYCAGTLARLHALAVGSSNPIPSIQDTPLPRPPNVFPPTSAFASLSAVCLQTVMPIVQSKLPSAHDNTPAHHALRDTVLTVLDTILHATQLTPETKPFAEHIRLFFELLLSRFTDSFQPFEIMRSAISLAEALSRSYTTIPHTNTTTSSTTPSSLFSPNRHTYNPFTMHFFTLTTITLLEFTSKGTSQSLTKTASRTLDEKIIPILTQISAGDEDATTNPPPTPASVATQSAENQTSHQQHQNGDETSTTTQNQVQNQTQTRQTPIHWADALLNMIEKRRKSISLSVSGNMTNGNANGASTSTTNNGPEPQREQNHTESNPHTNENTVVVDFALLLKYGYLTVLAESVGV